MDLNVDLIIRQKIGVKLGIVAGIVVIVLAVYYQVFYSPLKNEIDMYRPELAKLQQELLRDKQVVSEKPKYEFALEETRNKLTLALKQLPDKSEIPTLLENISSLGKAAGLEFQLFKPNPEVPMTFYAEIPVDIKVHGTYQDIVRFFDNVSKMPRIVNITDINVATPQKMAAGATMLTTTCKATTFKFIEGAASK